MKVSCIVAALMFVSCLSFGQKGALELRPYYRMDWYPKFSYVIDDRSSTDEVKMRGSSFGIGLAYKLPVSKTLAIKPGIGYYKYTFNHIERTNTLTGKSEARNINYISPLLIPFQTDKYWYNTLTASIGLEKSLPMTNSCEALIGLDLQNYYTISQRYHLTNNPEGSKDKKRTESRYFGASALLNFSIVKHYNKFGIGPTLMLPIFDIWKTDAVFPEETSSGTRNKVLRGAGIGVSLNYALD